jgi:predicted RNase H-like HicB family nuclease
MADGVSYQEAVRNVEVIMDEWIVSAREFGRTIPTPGGKLMYA